MTIRDAPNRLHTIAGGDVDSRVSLMPDELIETLTRDELVDLVAYLSTLGRVTVHR